jgi:hypothetical protein
VGELRGGLECLGSREAAGADEVVLHGEARVRGNAGGGGGGGREEAMVLADGRGEGRRDELGQDSAPKPEHGGAVAPAARGRGTRRPAVEIWPGRLTWMGGRGGALELGGRLWRLALMCRRRRGVNQLVRALGSG